MGPIVSSNTEKIPYTQVVQPVKQETKPVNQQETIPATKVSDKYVTPSMTVAEGPEQVKGRPQIGEILNDTYNTLASSPLGEENSSQKKKTTWFSVLKNIAVVSALFWGGSKLFKKINPKNVQHSTIEDLIAAANTFFGDIASRTYTKLDDLKGHYTDIVKTSAEKPLLSLNLHKAVIRVIDSTPDESKEIISTIKKIAKEARNVKGRTPIITVTLAESAQKYADEIAKAIKEGDLTSLSDEACKAMEYVKLDYAKASKKANNYLINVIESSSETNTTAKKAATGFSKVWNEFWGS